jgi:cell division protein FtsB
MIFRAPILMKNPLGRVGLAVAFLVVAGYAVITLSGPRGVRPWLEKQRQIHALEKHNTTLTQEIERKREHLKRLTNNPAEQELEIRDRLKYVDPKDKVFILEPQEK